MTKIVSIRINMVLTVHLMLLAPFSFADTPWKDSSCAFEKVNLKLAPKALVEEYAKRDFKGDFLEQNKWMDRAIICPGHAPGPDTATVVSKYEIVAIAKNSIEVKYTVVGTMDSNRFEPKPKVDKVVVKIRDTPYGNKIDDSFIGGNQHISIDTAIRLANSNKLDPKYIGALNKLKR